MIPFEAINATAMSALPSLLSSWFPAGRLRGHEYQVGDLCGNPGDSLKINTRTGQWADFAADAKGGDPISLFAAAFCKNNQGEAAKKLGRDLGVYVNGAAPPAVVEVWHPSDPPAEVGPPDLKGWDHVYTYRDRDGRAVRYVLRRDAGNGQRKIFVPLTWGVLEGKPGWHRKHPGAPRSLYNLDKLTGNPEAGVLVCEGEKAADAASVMFPKSVCVTWTAGTGNVARADWTPLAGRRVVVWPDNDEPGHKAAAELSAILSKIVERVQILRVDDLPPAADAADMSLDRPGQWIRDRLPIHVEAAPEVGRRAVNADPVKVRQGDIDLAADAGEQVLLNAALPVYQRGGVLVRPGMREVGASDGRITIAAALSEISAIGLVDMLAYASPWQKFDRRSGEWRNMDPPPNVASIILSRSGHWRFPSISGVITTPTLRPDGTILAAAGYDPATRLFHVVDPDLKVPSIPERPTKAQALTALGLLGDLLVEFPFRSDTDRAVALSALITPVVRGAMTAAPLHAFRANAPGSGKSFLADLASAVAAGRPCPALSASSDENETEKRLTGLLLASYPLISLDNVNGELGGDLLCQAVERPLIQLRELGRSSIFEIENKFLIYANGNGLRVRGDMTRRSLVCTLDAEMERPELRTFRNNPVADVLADRGRYVAAVLTIVRAYLTAGSPLSNELSPLASFEAWSKLVRGPLVWLGLPDPCLSMQEARDEDPELDELRSVLNLWAAHIGVGADRAVSARELIERAQQTDYGNTNQHLFPDFLDALLKVAGARGIIQPKPLGNWLRYRKGRIANGLRLVQARNDRNGIAQWAVEKCGVCGVKNAFLTQHAGIGM